MNEQEKGDRSNSGEKKGRNKTTYKKERGIEHMLTHFSHVPLLLLLSVFKALSHMSRSVVD
jgi:hypothetical protein